MRKLLAIALLALVNGAWASSEREALFAKLSMMAKQGNPEAEYHVGMMLNNGIGVMRNPSQAFSWFEKAARGGQALASYKEGCYYAGQCPGVVPIDEEKALEYKLIAAKAGYSLAQHDVAGLYARQGHYEEAVRWWAAAATQGEPISMHNLATAYKDGIGISKDGVKAYAYFKLSQLTAKGYLSEEAKASLDQVGKTLSPAELQGAELFVAQWKPAPTAWTLKARSGLTAAMELVGER